MSRRRVVGVAALACVAGYVYVYASGRAGAPIRSDAFSYYVYLPAWTLYHDPTLEAVAADCCGGAFPTWTAIVRWPSTGRWVDAHPIGEAILIAPFFAAAHALTRWSNLSPDGFNLYYQHGAGLAGLSYVLVGLWFLHRLLSRHFSEGVTAATLATLLFGTSLLHYATYDSAWSHAFSFALCAALLERLDAHDAMVHQTGIVIGLIVGLIALVRHTNVIIPICFFAAMAAREFGTARWPTTRQLILTSAIVAAIVFTPQLWVYYRATGHWLISAYGELGFNFRSPHVADVLVGTQKGLFFWAPVLLLGVAGLAVVPPALRWWRAPALAVLAVDTYLIASWWDWQFGGSYGHRGFVDVYPIFAVGLASLFARVFGYPERRDADTEMERSPGRLRPLRVLLCVSCIFLCALSVFQMLQYWHGVLPISDTTWAQYRAAFLKVW